MNTVIMAMLDKYKLCLAITTINRFKQDHVVPLQPLDDVKVAEGYHASNMHEGSIKISEYLDIVYKKILIHAHLWDTITSNELFIVRAKIELSLNFTIRTVAYKSLKNSFVVSAQ